MEAKDIKKKNHYLLSAYDVQLLPGKSISICGVVALEHKYLNNICLDLTLSIRFFFVEHCIIWYGTDFWSSWPAVLAVSCPGSWREELKERFDNVGTATAETPVSYQLCASYKHSTAPAGLLWGK